MLLADLLTRMYRKVFVGIYAKEETIFVAVIVLARNGSIEQLQETFGDDFSERGISFIQQYVALSPYNYIAILTDASSSGAVSTCSPSKAEEMIGQIEMYQTVCIEEGWMNYGLKEQLHDVEKRFAAVHADAIFSPFALLHCVFEQTMSEGHGVYVLLTLGAMSIAVVKERRLRFAQHFVCESDQRVALLIQRSAASLEAYYERPCCEGEFVEAVHIADGAGLGAEVAEAFEAVLLVEAQLQSIEPALLCARTLAKENGYAL